VSRAEPEVVTAHLLRDWPLPDLQDDKEARGRLLVVGGSRPNPGGVMLAAESALRVGAGKVRVATVASTAVQVAVALPEMWVAGLAEREDGQLSIEASRTVTELAQECDAVLLGPGMGLPEGARDLASRVLAELRTPVVVDALALSAVTEDHEVLSHLAGRAVLTPNWRELARTLGREESAVRDDPRGAALRLAARTGCCVQAGGAVTWTADVDGRSWRGAVGGPPLGTSGSGDVKAGIIAGLLARGAEPAQAAVWGAHLHGSAGDRLSASLGTGGFLARELAAQVPRVLAELQV
jgi:ADP-dependent NAD(P)H-hydrate dehydratase